MKPAALTGHFALYCMIGACAFLADYSVFLILIYSATNPYVANALGICAGIAISFLLNRKYNFRKPDEPLRRAVRFVTVALLGMGISTLSIMALVHWGMDVRIAKIFAMIVVFGFQFCANSLWTFR